MLIPDKMSKKKNNYHLNANIRMACVLEAINMQKSVTPAEYKDKPVLDVARELSEFVLGKQEKL